MAITTQFKDIWAPFLSVLFTIYFDSFWATRPRPSAFATPMNSFETLRPKKILINRIGLISFSFHSFRPHEWQLASLIRLVFLWARRRKRPAAKCSRYWAVKKEYSFAWVCNIKEPNFRAVYSRLLYNMSWVWLVGSWHARVGENAASEKKKNPRDYELWISGTKKYGYYNGIE